MALRKKLAIVGFSEKSRDFAPYDDPEWEIWGCNHVYRFVPRVDVLFEIHRLGELEAKYGPEKWKAYSEHLKTTDSVVYMMDEHPDFPKVKRLPIEALEAEFGYFLEGVELDRGAGKVISRERYEIAQFKSTLSYMLAMALREKRFETIAVYGVDMHVDSEWHFQRMNFAFFLGWARGMGVEIIIPENSSLLREAGFRLYGYESGTAEKYKDLIKEMGKEVQGLDAKLKQMDRENEHMVMRIGEIRGAIKLADQFAQSESFNGHREAFVEKKAALHSDLAELMERQAAHLAAMHEAQGARNKTYAWMDRLGYHNRGEMPGGRA